MWDNIVTGCQFELTRWEKAHWMLPIVSPFWT